MNLHVMISSLAAILLTSCISNAKLNDQHLTEDILSDTIHYVIIETNMSEVTQLEKSLHSYKPKSINLPDKVELKSKKSQPPVFWYRTAEGEPRKAGIYNSPSDTIGKEILEFNEFEYFIPDSGLDTRVNTIDGHYCFVIKHFINKNEATIYLEQLIQENIISKKSIAFSVSVDKYNNLKSNFSKYSNINNTN